MDWQEPSEDQRVVLGIIKLPAKSTDNPVSPVFFNPGVSRLLALYSLPLLN